MVQLQCLVSRWSLGDELNELAKSTTSIFENVAQALFFRCLFFLKQMLTGAKVVCHCKEWFLLDFRMINE